MTPNSHRFADAIASQELPIELLRRLREAGL